MTQELPEGPVTILFIDVEGSTDLRTERGDVVAHRILRRHLAGSGPDELCSGNHRGGGARSTVRSIPSG